MVGLTDAQGHVVEQYAWEPYGTVLNVETLPIPPPAQQPPPTNTIGHQGLFFYRFNETTTTDPNTLSSTAQGLYYNRNRWYSPHLGRFTTPDPNETGLATAPGQAHMGTIAEPDLSEFDPAEHFRDGLSLYQHLASTPGCRNDPSGLFLDTLGAVGLGLQMDANTADVGMSTLGAIRGMVDLVNARNAMLDSVAGLASSPVNTAGMDLALRLYDGYQYVQNAALGKGVLKAGVAFGKGGFAAMAALAVRKGGHHTIPKWAGGNGKQLLYNAFSWSDHKELESMIRERIFRRFGRGIGGVRGSRKAWERAFRNNPRLQSDVMEELMKVYYEYDKKHSSSVLNCFLDNYFAGNCKIIGVR